ncbi:RNA polymerase sigma factor [Tenacibaculum xiamenense]|uniref:RNA polymerase sigma factor n=1 Tax=Tenacibaculum xiamenense TaxID=1261553 RepID=UPI003893FAF5
MSSKTHKGNINFLARQIKNSNSFAFERLFDLLWEPLYVFAKSLLLDEEIAKDIVQEVWIDYWKRREKIETTNIKAFLHQAVRFKVYNHFRDHKFKNIHIDVISELETTSKIEDKHNVEERIFKINSALKNLSPRCQQVFSLSLFEGLTTIEIAESLGISKRTVENQLSIARKTMESLISITLLFIF